jgi:ribonuclease Z
MIHEATLGAGLEEEALQKKHTTTLQAMQLIDQIKPWRAILTHFSCRYMKLAEILPEHHEKQVLIAFDHMRLKLSHLEFAYKYLDPLSKLFAEDEAEEEQGKKDEIGKKKTNKR